MLTERWISRIDRLRSQIALEEERTRWLESPPPEPPPVTGFEPDELTAREQSIWERGYRWIFPKGNILEEGSPAWQRYQKEAGVFRELTKPVQDVLGQPAPSWIPKRTAFGTPVETIGEIPLHIAELPYGFPSVGMVKGAGKFPKKVPKKVVPEQVTPEGFAGKKVPKPEAKEPWQMTQKEWIDTEIRRLNPGKDEAFISRTKADLPQSIVEQQHGTAIQQALSEGKPVPAEVLKDYPDLAVKVPPVVLRGEIQARERLTEAEMWEKGARAEREAKVPPPAEAVPKKVAPAPEVTIPKEYQVYQGTGVGRQTNFFTTNPDEAIRYAQGHYKTKPVIRIYDVRDIEKRIAPQGRLSDLWDAERGEYSYTELSKVSYKEVPLDKFQPAIPKAKPVTPVEVPKPEVPIAKEALVAPIKPIEPPAVPPAEPSAPPIVPKVTTPTGKYWLPEPPRTTTELMQAKRKEIASAFRGKGGVNAVLDTVEQAHQMVLKVRDMGQNTIPYVMSRLRGAGDIVKEFGLTEGLTTKVGNPQNRSLAINDVLSNYTHYTLTPKQIEIAKAHGFVYQEALKLARSYGVNISELGGADEFWQYIARKVIGKLNPVTGKYEMPPTAVGGFRMGAKISAQKERVFDEMAQGLDLGFLYQNPNEVIASHIQGIYRLIGNKQAENLIEPLTRLITKAAPLQFGERAIAQPALRNRAVATEVANAIDKIFTPEQSSEIIRKVSQVSRVAVGQVAALDFSPLNIQGLTVLGHDIKMGLQGKPSAIWLKSWGTMMKTFWNPERVIQFRNKNAELYKRAIEAGVLTGESEFVSGVGIAQRGLGKIPIVGRTLSEAYKQSYGRAGAMYSGVLEEARIKMFKQLLPIWEKGGHNIIELGATVNKMTGTVSAAARGVSQTRRELESIGAFAPNYLRASLLLVKDLVGRGATAREVQTSILAVLASGATAYYAIETMRGEKPLMRPWAKRLGGDGADAYTFKIGETRVGLGSWMYMMLRTVADTAAIARDDPSALAVWDIKHPVVRLLKSKSGPLIGLVTELGTGKNFWGQKYDSHTDYLLRIVEALTPIASQSMITQEPKGTLAQVAAELLGMRSFPIQKPKSTPLGEWKKGISPKVAPKSPVPLGEWKKGD